MKLSVLVPSYNRVSDLERCLKALAHQTRFPDQVILVVRVDDTATLGLATSWDHRLPIDLVTVKIAGQTTALNAGVAAAKGDVIAITDDDAAPRPAWLSRIEQYFESDPGIGGVGGRDWVHQGSAVIEGQARLVGKIQWFGRIVGDHHLGSGQPRDVDILKGANMSYRRLALRGLSFDGHLRGRGAQVSNDMAFSLAVHKSGWRLVYDPAVAVDHYPAPRFDLDQRGTFQPQALEDAAFNQYWALLHGIAPGAKRTIACCWQLLVGSRTYPGLLCLAIGIARRDKLCVPRWTAAKRGRRLAAQLNKSISGHDQPSQSPFLADYP
jgi:GT2 family glycosyltransferase